MNSATDQQLLRDYSGCRSEAAFAELVRRHVDIVYSAALRMVRDAHLAEDVTQGVFVALAHSAPQLVEHPVLSGWLHRTAQNLAANAVRTDVRRRAREQEAAAMNELLSGETDATWEHIAPHLDAALGELTDSDRDALLLRYFERKSAQQMAQVLGVSDEAAQKRVSRAVERLREFLAKRGVTVGASGLVVVISTNAVLLAPAGLSAAITAAAVAGTAITTTALAAATKTIAMTTLQKTLIAATLAAAIGTGVYEARQAAALRAQVEILRQQQLAHNERIQQLTGERDTATRRLTGVPAADEQLSRAVAELLQLRAELTRLKAAAALVPEGDPTQLAAKAWLARVTLLKAYLIEHPEKNIPEVQFVSGRDWLSVTASDFETDEKGITAAGYERALFLLYDMGKMRFSQKAMPALRSYELTHDRQFPTDVSQLKVHFTEPIDDAVLQRYAVLPKSNFQGVRLSGDWVLAEITTPDGSTHHYVMNGTGSVKVPLVPPSGETLREIQKQKEAEIRPLIETLLPVAKAYAEAHEGRPPPDPEQMKAYATTPEQQSALQKLIQIRKEPFQQIGK